MKLKFFRSGKHTTSDGKVKEYTEKDIENLIDNYNKKKDDFAPLTIGHPENNSPALGWVEKLEKAGEWVIANIKDISEELKSKLKDNQYKYSSASIRDNMTLRHIGMVPVAAIKGTEILEYNEQDKTCVYTLEYSEMKEGNMDPEIKKLTEENSNLKKELEKLRSDADKAKNDFAEMKQYKDMSDMQKKQIEQLQKEMSDWKKNAEIKEISDFCDTLSTEGKLTPAEAKLQKDILIIAKSTSDFAENNVSLFDRIKTDLKNRKPLFNNTKTVNIDNYSEEDLKDPMTANKIINAYMEKNKCSRALAADAIYRKEKANV